MSAVIIAVIIAALLYASGSVYTGWRARLTERYFNRVLGDDERMPFLLWLAVVIAWPTCLIVIIEKTRRDGSPR